MEYSEQPVLFLEQDVDNALGNRNWRWWAAFEGDRAVLPEAMVSSGHQVADGSIIFSGDTFDDHYRGMVQAELSRAPQADIEAYAQRADDRIVVTAWITNLSASTLGPETSASVSALVYEDTHVLLTDRFVRAAPYDTVYPALAPGGVRAFRLETDALSGVAWDRLHTVVLVDYRPQGSEAYDMLQAAPAGPGTFTLTPGAITFLVDERGRHTGPVDLHLRGVFEGWVAMQHPDWITVSPGSGTLNDKPIASLAGETLSPGWQHGDIELLVTGVAGEAWTEYVAVSVYQGTVYHPYLPVVR